MARILRGGRTVWKLGRHRLVHGDATDADDVAAALEGFAPKLMVTDPPYGVDYRPEWRVKLVNERWRGMAKTARSLNDQDEDWREAWALFPGDVVYAWCASLRIGACERALLAAKFVPRSLIVWDKGRHILSRGHYHWAYEPCLYAVRKGATANWRGDRKQSTLWRARHIFSKSGHSNEKPVLCMERPILNHTCEGDAVYDPFVGSGTTIVAAEQSGRVCLAIELHPDYCRMAIDRWQKLTGQTAERVA